jgi:hypothetical protein
MFKRLALVSIGVILLLSLGVLGVALAQDGGVIFVQTDSYGLVPMINDGRLNGFDLAAPVAVYYTYNTVPQPDGTNGQVVSGIELLRIEPVTGNGQLALDVPLATLKKMIGNNKAATFEENGFTLSYSPSGWFSIEAPPDAEGKVYTFGWQNLVIPDFMLTTTPAPTTNVPATSQPAVQPTAQPTAMPTATTSP